MFPVLYCRPLACLCNKLIGKMHRNVCMVLSLFTAVCSVDLGATTVCTNPAATDTFLKPPAAANDDSSATEMWLICNSH